MDPTGWRTWSILVQAAAFIATAGVLAGAMAPFQDGLKFYSAIFIALLVLSVPFGLLPYAIARHAGLVRWRHAAIAGAVPGLLLGLILFFGQYGSLDSSSVGEVVLWQDGLPTAAGIAQSVAIAGLLSGIGALAGMVLKGVIPPDLLEARREPMRPRWRDGVPLSLAAVALAFMPASEAITRDRTCFNPFRGNNAPRSVSSVAGIVLHAGSSSWSAVAKDLEAHAKARGWLYRGTTDIGPGWTWFQHEICREPGIQIMVQHAPTFYSTDLLLVSVTVERNDIVWQSDLEQLVPVLKRHGRLTRDRLVETASPPAWYLALPIEPEAPATPPSTVAPTGR